MEVIAKILASPVEELRAPDLFFELMQEVTHKTYFLLFKHKCNIDEALKAQKITLLKYKSKFRYVEEIGELFGIHPN